MQNSNDEKQLKKFERIYKGKAVDANANLDKQHTEKESDKSTGSNLIVNEFDENLMD